MGSQFNMKHKKVLHLVKWEGWPEERDWMEEPYENFDEMEPLKQFHRRNPQAAKKKRFSWDSTFSPGRYCCTGRC
jgi:hypothetical protein